MSKIKTLGNAFTIISGIKMAALKNLAKFHPATLQKKDKDGKNVVFAIGVADAGKGSVTDFGVSFDSENADGFAQVTKLFPVGTKAEDREKYIVDNVGGVLLALNDFEDDVNDASTGLDAEIAAVKASITSAD